MTQTVEWAKGGGVNGQLILGFEALGTVSMYLPFYFDNPPFHSKMSFKRVYIRGGLYLKGPDNVI